MSLLNQSCVDPFSQYVWKFNYNFDTETIIAAFNEHRKKWYKSTTPLEIGNSYSSVASPDQPDSWEIFQDFNNWLAEPLRFLSEHWHFRPEQRSRILKSWFNIHGPSGETLEHCHSYANFVVSAYISKPKNSGDILFRDPLEYHKINWPMDLEPNLFRNVECNTNDVLIFPGWLKHKTEPNCSDSDRIVLTYNIGVDNIS